MRSSDRVLVIDDSPLICNLVENALTEAGFVVSQARGGEEGIEAAVSQLPAVVLCDLSMPDISGLEVVARLQQILPCTPIIMFTESIQLDDAVAAMRLGAFGYVNKGVVDHTLINEIRKAINHRRVVERNEELEQEAARHLRAMEHLQALQERQEALEQLLREKTAQICQLEQARARDDRISAIGSMVAGIAHEVNNPLAVIKAGARYLASELPRQCAHADAATTAELTSTIADLESGAVRIQRIIASVKKLAESSSPRNSCDPGETITIVMSQSRAQHSPAVRFAVELDPAATRVGLSREDLGLITSNLVTNAVQACGLTNPRGHVAVRVKSSGGTVTIEVQDDGCGIAAEDLRQVCNPFFTTKPPGVGLGLGLSLAHQVVKNASGSMQIESVLGSGTLVRLQLPAEANHAALRSPAARS